MKTSLRTTLMLAAMGVALPALAQNTASQAPAAEDQIQASQQAPQAQESAMQSQNAARAEQQPVKAQSGADDAMASGTVGRVPPSQRAQAQSDEVADAMQELKSEELPAAGASGQIGQSPQGTMTQSADRSQAQQQPAADAGMGQQAQPAGGIQSQQAGMMQADAEVPAAADLSTSPTPTLEELANRPTAGETQQQGASVEVKQSAQMQQDAQAQPAGAQIGGETQVQSQTRSSDAQLQIGQQQTESMQMQQDAQAQPAAGQVGAQSQIQSETRSTESQLQMGQQQQSVPMPDLQPAPMSAGQGASQQGQSEQWQMTGQGEARAQGQDRAQGEGQQAVVVPDVFSGEIQGMSEQEGRLIVDLKMEAGQVAKVDMGKPDAIKESLNLKQGDMITVRGGAVGLDEGLHFIATDVAKYIMVQPVEQQDPAAGPQTAGADADAQQGEAQPAGAQMPGPDSQQQRDPQAQPGQGNQGAQPQQPSPGNMQ